MEGAVVGDGVPAVKVCALETTGPAKRRAAPVKNEALLCEEVFTFSKQMTSQRKTFLEEESFYSL